MLLSAKVGVNKPELLPKQFSPVIDVAGFLSDGQVSAFPLLLILCFSFTLYFNFFFFTFFLLLIMHIILNNGFAWVNLQEKRLAQEIADMEKDTGFKLRVLAQNYPETPGAFHLFK